MLNFAERFACAIDIQAHYIPRIAEAQRVLRQAQALTARLLARIARSDVIVRSYWSDAEFEARRYERGFHVSDGTRARILAYHHRLGCTAFDTRDTYMHYAVLRLSAPNGYPLSDDEYSLLRAAFCLEPTSIQSWPSYLWASRRSCGRGPGVLLVAATTCNTCPAMVISIAND